MTGDTTPTRPITPAPAPTPAPRNPIVTGWMIAVGGLIVAACFGFVLMWIGSNRIEYAKKLEIPYRKSFSYLAKDAFAAVDQASLAIGTKPGDWRQAESSIISAQTIIAQMRDAASEQNGPAVTDIGNVLGGALTDVRSQDEGAMGKLDDAKTKLSAFIIK